MNSISKLMLLVICPLFLQAASFNIHDLGTSGYQKSVASRINNNNYVSGKITDQYEKYYDFIWDNEKGLTCLSYEVTIYQPPLINNRNDLAGIYWYTTHNWFTSNTKSKHFYIHYTDGTFKDIGLPPGWEKQEIEEGRDTRFIDTQRLGLYDFNDKEQLLVGNAPTPSNATKFAVWHKGKFHEIDPELLRTAYALNNQGEILGRKMVEGEPVLVLYNFESGAVRDIMKDVDLAYKKLNDAGQVAIIRNKRKKVEKIDFNEVTGFLWDEQNGLIQLSNFFPVVLNNQNQMVGIQLIDRKLRVSLWNDGELLILHDWYKSNKLGDTIAINDNGCILVQSAVNRSIHSKVIIPE